MYVLFIYPTEMMWDILQIVSRRENSFQNLQFFLWYTLETNNEGKQKCILPDYLHKILHD